MGNPRQLGSARRRVLLDDTGCSGDPCHGGVFAYLLTALVFGLVNSILGPVLRIATLPLRILTLGLFAFMLNAILLLAVAHLVPALSVDNVLTAVVGAFVLSIISALLNAIVGPILRAAVS